MTQSRIVSETDDFFLATQRVTTSDAAHARTVHFACQRVVVPRRILYAWETFSASSSVSHGIPAVQLVSQGYGSITELDGAVASRLQSFVRVTPSIPTDALDDDDTDRVEPCESQDGLVAELLVAAFEANAQTARQAIENALLDALTAHEAA